MKTRFAAVLFTLALVPVLSPRAQQAQPDTPLAAVLNAMTFRNVGPFRTAA